MGTNVRWQTYPHEDGVRVVWFNGHKIATDNGEIVAIDGEHEGCID